MARVPRVGTARVIGLPSGRASFACCGGFAAKTTSAQRWRRRSQDPVVERGYFTLHLVFISQNLMQCECPVLKKDAMIGIHTQIGYW